MKTYQDINKEAIDRWVEDTNGFGRLHKLNIKTYIATKSVKL
ncbi:hypothetical protein [Treponema putidum]|nr:hypothetical protein [Treponema putidum]